MPGQRVADYPCRTIAAPGDTRHKTTMAYNRSHDRGLKRDDEGWAALLAEKSRDIRCLENDNSFRCRHALWVIAASLALASSPAHADSLTLTANRQLRYGSFAVAGTGSRTVSATGVVLDSGVFPVSGPVGPAEFTFAFDRGGSSQPVTIVVQFLLASVPPVNQGGVTGTLSGFNSDLPGIPLLIPGQAAIVNITSCVTRICTQTFRIGARLDVTRASGGASLTIPLPVSATVLAVL